MVAIDDSLSMKENGSGNLALQALATLSRALSQLEVGELAIMSFGEQVKLLHGFEETFNDEAGMIFSPFISFVPFRFFLLCV